jgi:hypothetical protein
MQAGWIWRMSAMVGVSVTLVSCAGGNDALVDSGGSDDSQSSVSSSTTIVTTTVLAEIEVGLKAPFTGLPADEDLLAQPAVVVKIGNNDDLSLESLIGIDHADLVIEERIEDRATRFAVVFHSDIPEVAGPVRSGRTTDVNILGNLGTPIFAFSGANIGVLGQLRESASRGDVVLVANDDSGIYQFRDADYRNPADLFAYPQLIREDFAAQAGAAVGPFQFRSDESPDRSGGVDGVGVTVVGRDVVSFVFDASRGYVRVQDDAVHSTRDGHDIVVTNLIVMETEYHSSLIDVQSVDAVTLGEGFVHVMIGGRRFVGVWHRDAAADFYTLTGDDGSVIELEPGKTWLILALADSYEFAVDDETQGLVLGNPG